MHSEGALIITVFILLGIAYGFEAMIVLAGMAS